MSGFKLVSGLKTNYVGTVVDAEFTKLEKFENVVLALHLQLEDGTEWNESYGVGKGWFIVSPTTIANNEGRSGITSNSMYGNFISRVMALPGATEIFDKLEADGKGADDASSWIGFTFKFDLERIEYGKNINAVERNFPSEIVSYGKQMSASEQASDLIAQLHGIATKSANEGQFVQQAMQLPGVTSNGAVVDSLGEIWKNRGN